MTTLGETGGDAVTMTLGLGYLAGTAIFAGLFAAAVAAQIMVRRFHPFLYWAVIVATTTAGTTLADFTAVSRTLLFWAAFILTRLLGAKVGDFLDKPVANGGLALDRFTASAVLAVVMVACILVFPQRAGRHPGEDRHAA